VLRLIPILTVILICYHFDDPVHFSVGNLACLVSLYIMDYKFYNRKYEQEGKVMERAGSKVQL